MDAAGAGHFIFNGGKKRHYGHGLIPAGWPGKFPDHPTTLPADIIFDHPPTRAHLFLPPK